MMIRHGLGLLPGEPGYTVDMTAPGMMPAPSGNITDLPTYVLKPGDIGYTPPMDWSQAGVAPPPGYTGPVYQAPPPAPVPNSPAPAPSPATNPVPSSNPTLRAWIVANLGNPGAVYNRVFMQERLTVAQLVSVMGDQDIATVAAYFTNHGLDPYRMENIKNTLSTYPLSRADLIYTFVEQNHVTYDELLVAMGWDATKVKAILLQGAKMLGLTNSAPAPNYDGGGSSGGGGGGYGSGGGTYTGPTVGSGGGLADNKPILIAAVIIGGVFLMRNNRK